MNREILQHADGSTVAVDWLLHDADTRGWRFEVNQLHTH